MAITTEGLAPVGSLLREWRTRRHLSQLDLANLAGVSARHLSFVETGRSRPSREMVLHLAEHLAVPLRERNPLLVAAGYAPSYRASDYDGPQLASLRAALDSVLRGHEPYPAILVDRQWQLVASNSAAQILVRDVAPELLEPPVNVLRATLHPRGLAPRIVNLGEWVDHIMGNLHRQIAVTRDEDLVALQAELRGHVAEMGVHDPSPPGPAAIATPLRLRTPDGDLTFISMIATFGTAHDITLAELSIETFLPGDERTMTVLRRYSPADEMSPKF